MKFPRSHGSGSAMIKLALFAKKNHCHLLWENRFLCLLIKNFDCRQDSTLVAPWVYLQKELLVNPLRCNSGVLLPFISTLQGSRNRLVRNSWHFYGRNANNFHNLIKGRDSLRWHMGNHKLCQLCLQHCGLGQLATNSWQLATGNRIPQLAYQLQLHHMWRP